MFIVVAPEKIAELNVKRLSMLHTRKYKNSPQCQPAAITWRHYILIEPRDNEGSNDNFFLFVILTPIYHVYLHSSL